jgi:hypothetical protein
MELTFTENDIENWAEFSSDRNPIHFNKDKASLLGVSDVVAHGMLALLPVKHQVSQHTEERHLDCWTQFKAIFKSPIVKDNEVILHTKQKRRKLGFSLDCKKTNATTLIGNLSYLDNVDWLSKNQKIKIDQTELYGQFDNFRKNFSKEYSSWIWIDGLVFSHFIKNKIGYVIGLVSGENESSESQSSHQCTYDKYLREKNYTSQSLPEIEYQIDNIFITQESSGSFGTLELGVIINQQHRMTIEIGLLSKNIKNN